MCQLYMGQLKVFKEFLKILKIFKKSIVVGDSLGGAEVKAVDRVEAAADA